MAQLLLEKPRFSFFDKEIQWVDSHLHTNEETSERSFQPVIDIWPADDWDEAAGLGIQNTREQIKTALHAGEELS
ncbi:hypothetical protein ACVME5_008382 [Bradyrhizobium liaoningense]